jgi:hypothetical protein
VDGCPAQRRGDQGEKKTKKKKKKKKSPRVFSFVENNKMMRKGRWDKLTRV